MEEYKLLLVGAPKVGKTKLMTKYICDNDNVRPPLFHLWKSITQIWQTVYIHPYNRQFKRQTRHYCRGAVYVKHSRYRGFYTVQ
jgi:GTPase SAR1 family protein